MDLIVTQAVCEVAPFVRRRDAVAERLDPAGGDLAGPVDAREVLSDVRRLAEAAGVSAPARSWSRRPPRAIAAVQQRCKDVPRPRVAALEWLAPIYIGGHWVPQMIELAGGTTCSVRR